MRLPIIVIFFILFICHNVFSDDVKISEQSEECISCHSEFHPGIMQSWLDSRHSKVTPFEALQKSDLEKRISSSEIDSSLLNVVVGCYECHSLNKDKHTDTFEHNGFNINIVVSPNDCAKCHAVEAEQYAKNIMSHAYSNLMDNAVYQDFMKSVNGSAMFAEHNFSIEEANDLTRVESCLYCHGTKIEVTGKIIRDTDVGELEFPLLKGWPNQGIGRINPDGSKGSCTSCHPRHDFSIETARKPHTCAECHKGPDVPAYKVYQASKHGNIYESINKKFNFDAVPWKVGEDFTVPTCATCHASLIVDPENNVIVERTHQFNDRLSWRLFGVPYSHPHPVSPDINKMKNSIGLPLATELDGTPVSEFLITKEEQEIREQKMQQVCKSCHSTQWVEGHFTRLHNTIKTTNDITKTATLILSEIWNEGFAMGLPQKVSIFDEAIELDWTSVWFFHTNSIRFASAMSGGGDYGVFADGRFQLTEKIIKMKEWLENHKKQKK